jgi:hypothetical protein
MATTKQKSSQSKKDLDRQDTPGRPKNASPKSQPAKSQRKQPQEDKNLQKNQTPNTNSPSAEWEQATDRLRKAVQQADGIVGHSEIRSTVDRALVDLEYVDRRDLPPALV